MLGGELPNVVPVGVVGGALNACKKLRLHCTINCLMTTWSLTAHAHAHAGYGQPAGDGPVWLPR